MQHRSPVGSHPPGCGVSGPRAAAVPDLPPPRLRLADLPLPEGCRSALSSAWQLLRSSLGL